MQSLSLPWYLSTVLISISPKLREAESNSEWGPTVGVSGPRWGPTVGVSGPKWGPTVGVSGPKWGLTVGVSGPKWGPTVGVSGPQWGPTVGTSDITVLVVLRLARQLVSGDLVRESPFKVSVIDFCCCR